MAVSRICAGKYYFHKWALSIMTHDSHNYICTRCSATTSVTLADEVVEDAKSQWRS